MLLVFSAKPGVAIKSWALGQAPQVWHADSFCSLPLCKKQIFKVVITKIRCLLVCKKYNLKKKTWTESAASVTSRSVRKDFILLLIWDFNLCSYFAYWHQNWSLLFVTSKCSHALGKKGVTEPIHHQNLGYKRNVSSYLRKHNFSAFFCKIRFRKATLNLCNFQLGYPFPTLLVWF